MLIKTQKNQSEPETNAQLSINSTLIALGKKMDALSSGSKQRGGGAGGDTSPLAVRK